MKLSCFSQATKPLLWLVFAVLLQLGHKVNAQTVTYAGHNVPLMDVLQAVKLQTN